MIIEIFLIVKYKYKIFLCILLTYIKCVIVIIINK